MPKLFSSSSEGTHDVLHALGLHLGVKEVSKDVRLRVGAVLDHDGQHKRTNIY